METIRLVPPMKWIILPGMGATSQMYGREWRSLPHTKFIDWPSFDGESTVAAVADRVIDEWKLENDCIPVGSSLGGMVALEIASKVGAEAVCLVGSAIHSGEVSSVLRTLAPLATLTPIRLLQILAGSSRGSLSMQFASADSQFLRAMCKAVAEWHAPVFDERVLRIHGDHDPVIRCPDDAVVVRGAGHLVAVTHPNECVAAIMQFFAEE